MTVASLPFSVFSRAYQSANMLMAKEQLMAIEAASFKEYKKEDREKVIRHYKRQSSQGMKSEVKDFKEVAMNLARKLAYRG